MAAEALADRDEIAMIEPPDQRCGILGSLEINMPPICNGRSEQRHTQRPVRNRQPILANLLDPGEGGARFTAHHYTKDGDRHDKDESDYDRERGRQPNLTQARVAARFEPLVKRPSRD